MGRYKVQGTREKGEDSGYRIQDARRELVVSGRIFTIIENSLIEI
jgi:hypothetical protein